MSSCSPPDRCVEVGGSAGFTGAITNVQYGTLVFTAKWTANQPAGAILHTAYFDNVGQIHVAEVSDSPEALDAFLTQRLLPALDAPSVLRPMVSVHPVGTSQANEAIAGFVAMRSPTFVAAR